MAFKKKKSRARRYFSKVTHRAKKMTFPVAVIAGLMPGVTGTLNVATAQGGGWKAAGTYACSAYTGFNPVTNQFSMTNMNLGLKPLAIGVIVHKLAGWIGINKAIAGAGIPFIRI